MGRDERINDAVRRAELERTVGPVRDFGATQACDKCRLPRDGFVLAFCVGTSPLLDGRDGAMCHVNGEHLHVMCTRCRYGWHERCADHVGEDAIVNQSLHGE